MTTAWAVAVRRKRNAKNLLQRSSRYAAQESRESSAGGASTSSPNVGSLLEKVCCVGEEKKREGASGTAAPVNASAEASGAEAATSGNSSGNESNTTTATTTGHPRPEYDTTLDAGPTQAAPGGKLAPLGFTFPDYSGAKKLPKGDATMYVDQGLIGKVFTFEINMDGAMSNMAATYYLVREEPEGKLAGDANCKNPTGRCAAEMDFMEANNCGFRVAPHICQHDQTQKNAVVSTVGNHYPKPISGVKGDKGGPCDIGGCILAVFQMMAKDWVEKGARAPDAKKPWLWGPGATSYINSKQWHEVAYYFQKGPGGDLVGLWLRLKQGKRAATLPVCHPATATQYTPVIGAPGQYLKLMGNHLKAGKIWKVNHSYWPWWPASKWNWLTAAPGTNPDGAAADSNPRCDKVGQGYPAFFNSGLNETFRNVRMHDVA
eukprot:g13456.t1